MLAICASGDTAALALDTAGGSSRAPTTVTPIRVPSHAYLGEIRRLEVHLGTDAGAPLVGRRLLVTSSRRETPESYASELGERIVTAPSDGSGQIEFDYRFGAGYLTAPGTYELGLRAHDDPRLPLDRLFVEIRPTYLKPNIAAAGIAGLLLFGFLPVLLRRGLRSSTDGGPSYEPWHRDGFFRVPAGAVAYTAIAAPIVWWLSGPAQRGRVESHVWSGSLEIVLLLTVGLLSLGAGWWIGRYSTLLLPLAMLPASLAGARYLTGFGGLAFLEVWVFVTPPVIALVALGLFFSPARGRSLAEARRLNRDIPLTRRDPGAARTALVVSILATVLNLVIPVLPTLPSVAITWWAHSRTPPDARGPRRLVRVAAVLTFAQLVALVLIAVGEASGRL